MDSRASICTKCGARFRSDAKYCGFDGIELVQGEIEGEQKLTGFVNAKSCTKCLRRYPSYANYCGVDGTALEESIVSLTPDTGNGAAAAPAAPKAATKPKGTKSKSAIPKARKEKFDKTPKSETDEKSEILSVTPGQELTRDTRMTDTLIGKLLDGKYRIDSPLAEGGMAVLYRAHHLAMERMVVVKVIHSSLMYRQDMIERFKRECKLAARLSHPNIVNVYDFGFINGSQPYLVMEFIQGTSLATLIINDGPQPVDTAARIIMQTCSGLEEAHGAGIIHRDLKPDNILLQDKTDRPDWVKLVDFGIASILGETSDKRLTRTGVVIGTPEYMAPEQFTGKPLDVRTDIYALGVLIFEIMTGRAPFESPAYDVLMAQHLMDEVPSINKFRPDIDLDSTMDLLIRRCMAKAPGDRFQTVSELRKSVQAAFNIS